MLEVYINRKTAGILILISLMLITIAGCGGEAQTSTTAGTASIHEMRTFSKYDFSFQYPEEYLVWQDGLLDEGANENSGLVQVAPEEDEWPLFAVSWINTWKYGLEGGLEAGLDGVRNWEGIGTVAKGQVVETTKTGHRMLYQEGHRMLYQYYSATTYIPSEVVYGMVGSFYCPDTQRAFSLVTMERTIAGNTSQQTALAIFEDYVGPFVCH